MSSTRRALHFVYKIGNRSASMEFFQNTLGMKVLRHEEFEEGCEASCNGPYDGRWSKTMIGYGSEDDHFVCELTYNYGIGQYRMGNDFQGLTIEDGNLFAKVKSMGEVKTETDCITLLSPGGYPFHVKSSADSSTGDAVRVCSLSSTDLQRTHDYWVGLLGMDVIERTDTSLKIQYSSSQCALEFRKIDSAIDHAKSFGRVAFACPSEELPPLEALMKSKQQTILNPLVSLDTPGKATVHVVILADTDGHEICFVGDEAFRELSQIDPNAAELLAKAIEEDNSDDWYKKKGKSKAEEQ